jgi:bifunctional DNA-binding transcriptional regulator/antitoxin component of YhaV-PrlF toxin-antitoxin module
MSGEEGPRKEYMHYCGRASLREEDAKDVSDGLNGTMTLKDSDVSSIGGKPGSLIRILAESNGRSVVAERKIHSNGRSVTLPLGKRRELNLDPGDEIEWWIELVEREPGDGSPSSSSTSATSTDTSEEMDQKCLWFVGESEFHYIEDEDAEETQCGEPLDDRDYRIEDEEPSGFLTVCPECNVKESSEMTNEEIVDWFAAEAGFDPGGGPPSYFNKEQLVILRDWALDLKERAEE